MQMKILVCLFVCFAIVSIVCVDDLYAQKKGWGVGGAKYGTNTTTKVNVRFYCGHLGAVDVKNLLNSESARVEAG